MLKNLLLLNLGSPDSPAPKDVARYLRQFLTDPYVIDIPAPLRYALVYGIIAPTRSSKSGEAYAKIWQDTGSPLVHHTRQFSLKVAKHMGSQWNVQWAMRYGSPSVASVIHQTGEGPLWVVPLYPQYASSSTQTAIDEVKKALRNSGREVHFLEDFFNAPAFIEAQAELIQSHLDQFKPDRLLLSFHGLPEHHLTKLHSDHCLKNSNCCDQVTALNRYCYRAQCVATVKALKAKLQYPDTEVVMSFQSRLGSRPWIKPYTDIVIEELARSGAKRILVSCPSFVADCLETLEEIQIRLREQFISLGGEELQLIPALNSGDHWVQNFSKMIGDWAKH